MWTTPRTWSDGDTITASVLNVHIRDNLLFLYASPRAKKQRTSNVEITSTGQSVIGSFEGTHVEMDITVYDNDSMAETDSPVNLICNTAGHYLFTGAGFLFTKEEESTGVGVAIELVVAGTSRARAVTQAIAAQAIGLVAGTISAFTRNAFASLYASVGVTKTSATLIGAGEDAPAGARGPMLSAHWVGGF